ncbi:MAG: DUF1289 domain-containing protein [Pseudomonadota bacterium]
MTISPCTNVCRIDPLSGYCLGCQRTAMEIAEWTSLDEAARHRLMDELPARRPPSHGLAG